MKALPVFADTDPETLTIDPASIESRITNRTRAIVPVHIYGMPCDMDPINAVAKKHNLGVVEDACQAWLAEYKGRKCGTLADLGCFSFQNSKHLPSGEGGAITGNSDELLDRCHAFHNCGQAHGHAFRARDSLLAATTTGCSIFRRPSCCNRSTSWSKRPKYGGQVPTIWLRSSKRFPASRRRGCRKTAGRCGIFTRCVTTRSSLAGLPRDKFMEALRAEGVPCSGVYHEQYFDGLLDEAINSRGYQRLFGAERLKAYRESFQELKGNRQVCSTTVAMTQNMLLAKRGQLDQIVEAIRKIQVHSKALARA